eukprot:CAMPEP_0175821880 /NCGR_PEP_ID=MMETSP0107_2-20121207/9381_1 /TAXON_ID=195067 ORGANISM="Goniomonas pacifica, Strain CCMP1869" /NCGR_SAMPLE_ID=MMETSP0107_2 /ASSEMBLY_ACC=CAM_ASM_000203 /LENGTH=32 /DNA_ID= /DNA_START= /DNA_END= /DNA_ORIENTATION=
MLSSGATNGWDSTKFAQFAPVLTTRNVPLPAS